jgi:ATP-dependent DNA helicase PIF1
MRADDSETDFKDYLLSIGRGNQESDSLITLPQQFISRSLADLMVFVFGDFSGDLSESAILCPTNYICEVVNDKIVGQLDSQLYELRRIDIAIAETPEERNQLAINYPTEYLNSKLPNGLPPHNLKLKVGVVVILLRNLNPAQGLCNGTRLRVDRISTSFLTTTVMSGPKTGSVILLPRITLISEDASMPFKLSRYQFPVRIAFAMTINKAQGQTLKRVGVYLPQPVFSHGQLYVAFSRVRRATDLRVCVEGSAVRGRDSDGVTILNIVYSEVL